MTQRQSEPSIAPLVDEADPDLGALECAILRAVAYADIFDCALSEAELQRYLIGVAAAPELVRAALAPGAALVARRLVCSEGYIALAERLELIELRQERQELAARLWPTALRYGRIIAELPFVKMVAVTGALAVNNVAEGADIDYLIVTEPGRLWLCRALVIALVRLAARSGDLICPNYLLSERALELHERTLYTAHELTQMAPISGPATYERLRRLNVWADDMLPNASGAPHPSLCADPPRRAPRRLAEAVLRTPLGARLERWEMQRKIQKLSRQEIGSLESAFSVDWCKGHFGGYGRRTLAAYNQRVRALGIRSEM